MNQILITGEEVVEKVKVKKPKTVLPINGIIVFYAVSIIILGICMISGSVYAGTQINETVKANKKPEITLVIKDDNTIEISATHIRKLKTLTYKWNDEEEIDIDTKNENNASEVINLIGGENKLIIYAEDETGKTQTLTKSFDAGNIPQIKIDSVDNGIKIKASCEDTIEYIEYSWDSGENQKIEVNDKQYDALINAPLGKHILRVEVVTVNDMKAKLEKEIIGDTEPIVNVQPISVNGKPTFVIDIEDDEGIKTVSIIHNGGEKQIINVNEKTFHKEVQMVENEENTIIITAININGIQETRRIRIRK